MIYVVTERKHFNYGKAFCRRTLQLTECENTGNLYRTATTARWCIAENTARLKTYYSRHGIGMNPQFVWKNEHKSIKAQFIRLKVKAARDRESSRTCSEIEIS